MFQPAGFALFLWGKAVKKIQISVLILSLVTLSGHALFAHGFSVALSPTSLAESIPAISPSADRVQQAPPQFIIQARLSGGEESATFPLAITTPDFSRFELRVIESPWKDATVVVIGQASLGTRIFVARESYFVRYGRLGPAADPAQAASAMLPELRQGFSGTMAYGLVLLAVTSTFFIWRRVSIVEPRPTAFPLLC